MKAIKNILFLLVTSIALTNCSDNDSAQPTLSYLALGDSYTIGEGVTSDERWPSLLVDSLNLSGLSLHAPTVIAKTGWRTDQLLDSIMADAKLRKRYELVSLLIGANNQVQGQSAENFAMEFESLLQKSIALAGGDPERVFVLSIPDYGKTPFGIYLGGETISREILSYNQVSKELCDLYDVRYFNITPISEGVINDPSLLGSDNFHPSGKMYKQWVTLMIGDVIKKLSQ